MVVVPLSRSKIQSAPVVATAQKTDWVGVAAGSGLLVGALLLLNGQRKAGTAAAAAGLAVALLDQKETLLNLWETLPAKVDDLQRLLGNVQGTLEDLEFQRVRLRQFIAR